MKKLFLLLSLVLCACAWPQPKPFGLDVAPRADAGYSPAGVTLLNSSIGLDMAPAGVWNPCCVIFSKPLPAQCSIEIRFLGRLFPGAGTNAPTAWIYDDSPAAVHPEFVDIEPSYWGDPNNPNPLNLSCWSTKTQFSRQTFPANLFTSHVWTIGLYSTVCRARCDGVRADGSTVNYAYAEWPIPFKAEHHTLRIGCILSGPVEAFAGPSKFLITSVKISP